MKDERAGARASKRPNDNVAHFESSKMDVRAQHRVGLRDERGRGQN